MHLTLSQLLNRSLFVGEDADWKQTVACRRLYLQEERKKCKRVAFGCRGAGLRGILISHDFGTPEYASNKREEVCVPLPASYEAVALSAIL